jgi:hypothetical protein
MKLNTFLGPLACCLWLQGSLFAALITTVTADPAREQSVIDVASWPEQWLDDSLVPSTLAIACPGCPSQPTGCCPPCKDNKPPEPPCCNDSMGCCTACTSLNASAHCCRCWNPCCCSKDVCTLYACLSFKSTIAPDNEPDTAYLTFLGLGDDAPCCGPTCSMDRCLELVRSQLEALQSPLEQERNKTKENTDLIGSTEDANCCGSGCSARGCFQNLLDTIIKLQNPILETLEHFNKSRPDTKQGSSEDCHQTG